MKNKNLTRALAVLVLGGFVALLSSCTTPTDESRTTQEAGGTIPWNRPEKWEGGGALGSQMQQFNQ